MSQYDVNTADIKTISQLDAIVKRLDMYLGSSTEKFENIYVPRYNQQTQSYVFIQQHEKYQTSTQQFFTELIQNSYDNFVRSNFQKDYYVKVILHPRSFMIENNGPVFKIQTNQDFQKLEDTFSKPNTSTHYSYTDQANTAGMNGLGAKICCYISKKFFIKNTYNGNQYCIQWSSINNTNILQKKIDKKIIQKNNSLNSFQVFYELPDPQYFINEEAGIRQQLSFVNFNFDLIFRFLFELSNLGLNIKLTAPEFGIKQEFQIPKIPYHQLYQLQPNTYYNCQYQNQKQGINLIIIPNKVVSFCVLNGITSYNGTFINNIKKSLCKKLAQLDVNQAQQKQNSKQNFKRNSQKVSSNNTSNINLRSIKVPSSLQVIVYGVCPGVKYNDQIKQTADFKADFDFKEEVYSFIQSMFLTQKVQKKPLNAIQKLIEAKMNSNEEKSLILTEGDSAKTIFERLNDIYHKYSQQRKPFFYKYGLFPLKGKVLNIRKTTESKNLSEEIKVILEITGLQKGFHYDYNTIKQLRYQKIIIASDFDEDGFHIKNLLINLFLTNWPELIHLNYLQEFISPILSIEKYKQNQTLTNLSQNDAQSVLLTLSSFIDVNAFNQNQRLFFYNKQDFEQFSQYFTINKTKYYKGLGTLEDEDLKMIAQNINYYIKTIVPPFNQELQNQYDKLNPIRKQNLQTQIQNIIQNQIPTDNPQQQQLNNLIQTQFLQNQIIQYNLEDLFSTSTTNRKALIMNYQYTPIDYKQQFVPVTQNFNQFLEYGYTTQNRAIPSEIDGLKDSQRKIIYYVLKNLSIDKQIKVAQLSSYVAASLEYLHGDGNLDGAIVHLAQNFTGSNNLPTLTPKGSFGTRSNPENYAASRYIYVSKPKYLDLIFRKEDELIYQYNLSESGDRIEPKNLYPIIPLHLINGVKGIGTGFSSTIPNHHPIQVIDYIMMKLNQNQIQNQNNNLNNTSNNTSNVLPQIVNLEEFILIPWFKDYVGKVYLNPSKSQYITSTEDQIQYLNNQSEVIIPDVSLKYSISKVISYMKEQNICGDIELLGETKLKISIKQQANAKIWEYIKSTYLTGTESYKNMTVLKDNQYPKTYFDAKTLLNDWIQLRYNLYIERKKKQLKELLFQFVVQYNLDQFVKKQVYKLISTPKLFEELLYFIPYKDIKTFCEEYTFDGDISKLEDKLFTLVNTKKEFNEIQQNETSSNKTSFNKVLETEPYYHYLTYKTVSFYQAWKGYDKIKNELINLYQTPEKDIFIKELTELKQYIINNKLI